MKKCILVLAVVAVLFSTCYAQSALTRMMLLQSLMGNQQGSGAAGSSTGTGAGSTGSASSNLLSGSGGLSSLMLMNGGLDMWEVMMCRRMGGMACLMMLR